MIGTKDEVCTEGLMAKAAEGSAGFGRLEGSMVADSTKMWLEPKWASLLPRKHRKSSSCCLDLIRLLTVSPGLWLSCLVV